MAPSGRCRRGGAGRSLQRAGAYIQERTTGAITRVASDMQATTERYYIYGAYQALVLDRLFPGWKTGLFENDRTLDDVLAERLAPTAGDREQVAARFASVYGIDEIRARVRRRRQGARGGHRRRAEPPGPSLSRRREPGAAKLRHPAARGRDVRAPSNLYLHGLDGLDYGSMKLVSVDTPMRLVGNIVEWVDTEPAAGEKGYDLKYEEQAGELFKKVTLKTKGFSFSAKAIRLVDDGKTVTFFIVD